MLVANHVSYYATYTPPWHIIYKSRSNHVTTFSFPVYVCVQVPVVIVVVIVVVIATMPSTAGCACVWLLNGYDDDAEIKCIMLRYLLHQMHYDTYFIKCITLRYFLLFLSFFGCWFLECLYIDMTQACHHILQTTMFVLALSQLMCPIATTHTVLGNANKTTRAKRHEFLGTCEKTWVYVMTQWLFVSFYKSLWPWLGIKVTKQTMCR